MHIFQLIYSLLLPLYSKGTPLEHSLAKITKQCKKDMKKNIIRLGFASVFLLGGIYFCLSSDSEKSLLNNLALKNIEALAGGEGSNENYDCIGSGDVDCHGYKVARAYTGLSLD